MTTKFLSGLYDGPGVGYSVGGDFAYSALSITSTGTLLGGHGANAAPSTGPFSPKGGNGYAGLFDRDAGAPVTNSGRIGGGAGGSGGAPANAGILYGTNGGAGGYGARMAAGGYLANLATIVGGAGGAGGGGIAAGGTGNAGVGFGAAGSVVNSGAITGGAGGLGGGSTSGAGTGVAGHGGGGGWGVVMAEGSVDNSGAISGGAGGVGGQGTIGAGGKGGGGAAALMLSAGITLNNTGVVVGGAGGAGGAGQTSGGAGGAGGDGVDITAVKYLAAHVTNTGTIRAGAGGAGGAGGTKAGHAGAAGAYGLSVGGPGTITNGSSSVGDALISGVVGVNPGTGAVTVINFATIQGTGGTAVFLDASGDRLIAEAGSTFIGASYGPQGTLELAGGTGTISGLGVAGTVSGAVSMTFREFAAYQLDSGGSWTLVGSEAISSARTLINAGSATVKSYLTDQGALANSAGASLTLANGTTVQVEGVVANAGTIALAGAGFNTDLRILPAGATLIGGGEVTLGGPTSGLLGYAASDRLTNVDNTIIGSGLLGAANSLTLVNLSKGVIDATGTLTVDTSGATLTNGGLMEATSGGTLLVASTTVNLSGGTIFAAGGVVQLKGADILGGTLASSGSGAINAGSATSTLDGTKTAVALTGVAEVLAGFALNLVGSIANSGKLALYGGKLIIGGAGATLSGAGRITLNNTNANAITASAAGATLTNVDDTIVGAGTIGGGTLSLINDAGGLITNSLATPLVINTGTATAINAGLIEATGGGRVRVISALENTGHLWAKTGGALTLSGLVTGGGVGNINGGTLIVADAFAENVSFSGTGGMLELEDSVGYTGFVSGLDSAGSNSLDLSDIGFTSGVTTATYSGTTASGTLTVTDGTHTAHIKLAGSYATGGFKLSSDGHGGTRVVDPAPPPGSAALAQAMATFQIGAPSGHAGTPAWQVPKLPLAHVHG